MKKREKRGWQKKKREGGKTNPLWGVYPTSTLAPFPSQLATLMRCSKACGGRGAELPAVKHTEHRASSRGAWRRERMGHSEARGPGAEPDSPSLPLGRSERSLGAGVREGVLGGSRCRGPGSGVLGSSQCRDPGGSQCRGPGSSQCRGPWGAPGAEIQGVPSAGVWGVPSAGIRGVPGAGSPGAPSSGVPGSPRTPLPNHLQFCRGRCSRVYTPPCPISCEAFSGTV